MKANTIGEIYLKTFKSFLYPQVLLCFILPFIFSVLFWFIMVMIYWQNLFLLFSGAFTEIMLNAVSSLSFIPQGLVQFLSQFRSELSGFIFIIILVSLILPLIIVTTSVISSFIASTYLIQFIGKKEFPQLIQKGSSRILKSVLNSLAYSVIFLFLWCVTLPFIFIPPLGLLITVALTAWYNLKVSRFDILTEWCDDTEMNLMIKSSQGYVVSLIGSLTILVPFAFFFTGIFVNVALTNYYLDRLAQVRKPG